MGQQILADRVGTPMPGVHNSKGEPAKIIRSVGYSGGLAVSLLAFDFAYNERGRLSVQVTRFVDEKQTGQACWAIDTIKEKQTTERLTSIGFLGFAQDVGLRYPQLEAMIDSHQLPLDEVPKKVASAA